MITTVSRKIEWDMGHRIPNHESLCQHPHGHRYVAEVVVEGPVIETEGSPKEGMVEDFGFLKDRLSLITRRLDHSFMVYKDDPFNAALALFEKQNYHLFADSERRGMRIEAVDFIPTAENIAAMIFTKMTGQGLKVLEVTVWETPNCKATVRK